MHLFIRFIPPEPGSWLISSRARVSPWASKARHIGLTPWDPVTAVQPYAWDPSGTSPEPVEMHRYGCIITDIWHFKPSDLGTFRFWNLHHRMETPMSSTYVQAPLRDIRCRDSSEWHILDPTEVRILEASGNRAWQWKPVMTFPLKYLWAIWNCRRATGAWC